MERSRSVCGRGEEVLLLAKSELRCGLPQLLDLAVVISLDERVVNHEQRVHWNITRKGDTIVSSGIDGRYSRPGLAA